MTNEELRAAILTEVRSILSSEEKWTKGVDARDAAGEETGFDQPDATCFCLLGAYMLARQRVTGAGYMTPPDPWFLRRHRERFPDWGYEVHEWNDADTTTYEDVVAFLEG